MRATDGVVQTDDAADVEMALGDAPIDCQALLGVITVDKNKIVVLQSIFNGVAGATDELNSICNSMPAKFTERDGKARVVAPIRRPRVHARQPPARGQRSCNRAGGHAHK